MSEMDPRTEDLDEVYAEEAESDDPGEVGIETPDADAAEQRWAVDEARQRPLSQDGYDIDEADAADQKRAIGFDDDDYR